MLSDRAYYCRMCGAEFIPDDDFCPRCGVQGRTGMTDPVEVSTKDVVRSVFMAFIALTLTSTVSWYPIQRLITRGWSAIHDDDLIASGLWNFYILGLPALFIVRGWYTRVRRGEFNHAWIWRGYWFVQLMVLLPFVIIGGCLAVIWIAASVMNTLSR